MANEEKQEEHISASQKRRPCKGEDPEWSTKSETNNASKANHFAGLQGRRPMRVKARV